MTEKYIPVVNAVAFKKYDKDGNGVITRDEFRKVVEDKYQARLRADQIDQMMLNVDKIFF